MAKNKKKELETVEEIEVALTRSEQFIEKNQKSLLIAVIAIFGIVLAYWGYSKYSKMQNEEAMARMFTAERYFERDSFKLAINGDPANPGFIDIINRYSGTKAANLAEYYVGISYLNLGNYDQAIQYLDDFDSDDMLVKSIATGGIGDAYMEKGQVKEALNYYLKASAHNENSFTTPLYLMKAGLAYEKLNDYQNALKLYEDIKKNFKESNEGRKIEKYITRANIKMNKS